MAENENSNGYDAHHPNVLFILADDLGFSDLGCYGGEIQTPNLDLLAEQGLRYTQFYNTARCWPSRAALMTGYYPHQVNRHVGRGVRPGWAQLIPRMLQPAGYRSYHSGKWHIDGAVLESGFDQSYYVRDQNRFFTPTKHFLNDQLLPVPKIEDGYYATDVITDYCIDFVKQHEAVHDETPFFFYLAYTAPHFPLHAIQEDIERCQSRYQVGWDQIRHQRLARLHDIGITNHQLSILEDSVVPNWNLSEQELVKQIGPGEVGRAVPWTSLNDVQKNFQSIKMAIHAAMIERMDQQIGRVMDELKTSGEWKNTIVFFASDNGASAEQIIRADGHLISSIPGSAESHLCLGPGWSTAANTPFRKHKYWTHEGGISTPLIVHWPEGIKEGGTLRTQPAHLVDIAPTLLELSGQEYPDQIREQNRPRFPGMSLVRSFDNPQRQVDREIFFEHNGNRALRVGNWKIVSSEQDQQWELYNLAKDRSEQNNLSHIEKDRLSEMVERWELLWKRYQSE